MEGCPATERFEGFQRHQSTWSYENYTIIFTVHLTGIAVEDLCSEDIFIQTSLFIFHHYRKAYYNCACVSPLKEIISYCTYHKRLLSPSQWQCRGVYTFAQMEMYNLKEGHSTWSLKRILLLTLFVDFLYRGMAEQKWVFVSLLGQCWLLGKIWPVRSLWFF